jgi:heme oxygenase
MIADQIKNETLTHHQALEALMVRQLKSMKNAADYTDVLEIFYSYFGGLELRIHEALAGTFSVAERRKAGDLASDIEHFGAKVPALASGDDLPRIDNHLQAIGALYVIEGSTLGGIHISNMISKQLELADNQGLRFFNGYGNDTAAMWESFKAYLNQQPQNENEEREIIAAANETFVKFKQWMENFPQHKLTLSND